ncbi:MAG: nucleotide exchange factor GrpE [Armatimonadetes bacterium]|nr:nucleotide exchange factor GrpE [Armatimonadota bacterium]
MSEREQRHEEVPSAAAPGEGVQETAGPAESPDAQVEKLRTDLVKAREEVDRNWQQFMYAAADLENYKKEAQRRLDEAVTRTRRQMLGVVLQVVDNLERALRFGEAGGASGDAQLAVVEGIRLTHRQALDLLAGLGVRPVECVGAAFDPRLHEVVEAVDPEAEAAEGRPSGTIVGEVERGYLLNAEVLRPARVRVVK